MKRFFNVAGPCFPGEHYMIPYAQRCQGLQQPIDQKLKLPGRTAGWMLLSFDL